MTGAGPARRAVTGLATAPGSSIWASWPDT